VATHGAVHSQGPVLSRFWAMYVRVLCRHPKVVINPSYARCRVSAAARGPPLPGRAQAPLQTQAIR
jgi:hypothetical protein